MEGNAIPELFFRTIMLTAFRSLCSQKLTAKALWQQMLNDSLEELDGRQANAFDLLRWIFSVTESHLAGFQSLQPGMANRDAEVTSFGGRGSRPYLKFLLLRCKSG